LVLGSIFFYFVYFNYVATFWFGIWLWLLWVYLEFQNLQVPSFMRLRADPKNVISIVLGGGPGTHLYPLTKRAATPAVNEIMLWYTRSGLDYKQIFIF
jgi:hypothetical protein